ncbi:hypothetical protein [Piscirickettsia litoralis]|uniref:ADP ribosyltransferase domain-containing protein n=1 Tax=Piscirickettsia litoralis TaxID=1891921 RepID=A0ABX2ZYF4_9GAMM|nr:hypothetical protein [Piscirickettsia litoralis]ODN41533.1 hypothetical protein BGC07_15610 [Piscirickettsia litoralis]
MSKIILCNSLSYERLESALRKNYDDYYNHHLRSDDKKRILYIHNSFSLGFGKSRKRAREDKRKFGYECFVKMYEDVVCYRFQRVMGKRISEKESSFIRVFINNTTNIYQMKSITIQEALFFLIDIKEMKLAGMSRYIQGLIEQRGNTGISGLEHRKSIIDSFRSGYVDFSKARKLPSKPVKSKVELHFDYSDKSIRSDSVISSVDFEDYGELKKIDNPASKYYGQYETVEALASNHEKWIKKAEQDRVMGPTKVYRGMDSSSILEQIERQGGLWHNNENYRKGQSFNPYNLYHHDRLGYLSLFFGQLGATYSMGMSTTTDIEVAKNYTGQDGIILEIILEHRNMAFYLNNCPELKEINVARRIAPRQIVAVWHYDSRCSKWVRIKSCWVSKKFFNADLI